MTPTEDHQAAVPMRPVTNSGPADQRAGDDQHAEDRVDRLAAFVGPVNVFEVQPERELVHGQADARPEDAAATSSPAPRGALRDQDDARADDDQDAEDLMMHMVAGDLDVAQPGPAAVPDLISLVTVLVTRKVTRMARNIHIMGCSPRAPPALTVSFTPEASEGTALAASTRTAPSPLHRLMPGFYAPGCPVQAGLTRRRKAPPALPVSAGRPCGSGRRCRTGAAGHSGPGPCERPPRLLGRPAARDDGPWARLLPGSVPVTAASGAAGTTSL